MKKSIANLLTYGLSGVLGVGAISARAESEAEEARERMRENRPNMQVSDFTSRQQAFELRSMASPAAAPWEPLGPFGVGRLTDIEADPNNAQIVYVGTASGGAYKSTNGGTSFAPLTNNFKSQSIGDIAIDPNNPNTIWIGGGEAQGGGGSLTYPGNGIDKSADGGATWTHMGLDPAWSIARVSVQYGNSNVILAAVMGDLYEKNAYRGVYRSADGGATWTKVAYLDDTTGAADVRFLPATVNGGNTAIACFWSAQRKPFARTWGGPNSKVMRSTNGGVTWTELGTAAGLPTTNLGKNTIDFSKANPNAVYMIYLNANDTYKGVYRSTDAGATWAQVSGSSALPGAAMFSFYGHSFGQIRVSPWDANDVIVFGITAYRSTNGGASWAQCMVGTHADIRAFSWTYQNANTVYGGDDGGFATSTGGPNGTFTYRGLAATGGLSMAQMYIMDVAASDANRRYAGFQDNYTQMTLNGATSNWTKIIDGDGMYVRVDQGANSNVIGCWQFGNCQRSTTSGTGMAAISGLTGRGPWDAPVAIDPANGQAFIGFQNVFRGARGATGFANVSPDLTNGDHSVASYSYGGMSTIAVNNGVAYAGTDDGNVWVSQNASGTPTWTKIRSGTSPAPAGCTGERCYNGWIKNIWIDPAVTNGSEAYVGVNYFRWGTSFWKPALFKITNFGSPIYPSASWQDISGDLPSTVTVNKVVKDNAAGRVGWLYAATDYGVYMSTNNGLNWSWMGDQAMPILPVNDLTLHTASNYLYVGTYGRGMWRINLATVTPVKEPGSLAFKNQFLKAFPNPVTASAQIQFQVRDAQELHVAIYDFMGREVRTLFKKKADANKAYTLSWDGTNNQGSRLSGGSYILRAIGAKVTLARKMEVKAGS